MPLECSLCPSCDRRKRSAAVNRSGLCDECNGGPARAKKEGASVSPDLAFTVWTFRGRVFLAVPKPSGVHVLGAEGTNYGGWFSVVSCREAQRKRWAADQAHLAPVGGVARLSVSVLDAPPVEGENRGHGHVSPRPDGVRIRCGGPNVCPACAAELAAALRV